MFRRSLALAALAAAYAFAPGSAAQSISGGPNFSTLGGGAEVGISLTDFVGIRLIGNYLPFDSSIEVGGIDYDFDINLITAGGVIDIYPFGPVPFAGGLRFSAGLRWNGNQIDVRASPAQPIVIGSAVHPAGTTVFGDIEFNSLAPYLGIGYSAWAAPFVRFGIDLGVLYQGRPDVSLRTNAAVAAADLRREEQEIEDDLDFLRFYPVLALSLIVKF